MKKVIVIILLLVSVLGTIIFFVLRSRGASGQAVLKVTANTTSSVFLDNQNVGKTPLEYKANSGEFSIKLIPETTVDTVVPWEDKIKLNANLLTYVNRELGSSELTSGGEVLTLEKAVSNKGELIVLSTPDGASVKLNTEDKGSTPVTLTDIDAGNYDLTVSTSGFKDRTVKVKITSGYKLTASFQLVAIGEGILPSPEATTSASPAASAKPGISPKPSPTAKASPAISAKPKASPPAKPYIEVLDTPTDFLNVRKEPSKSSEILTTINPGEFYSLLDEETVKELVWYKIAFESDKEGWVSSQYAKKFE